MKDKNNSNIDIDFSKMDASLEKLVLSIYEWDKKNNHQDNKPKEKTKRVVKKLNVDLIRQVLQETKELQQRKKEDNNDK